MKPITISINNNKCHLITSQRFIDEVRKEDIFKYRHPGAFFIKQTRSDAWSKTWDGYVYHLTEAGYFPTGLLPRMLAYLDKEAIEYELEDLRPLPKFTGTPQQVGKQAGRDYQLEFVSSVTQNYIGDLYFPRGLLNGAVNAGKTWMMMAIHLSYKKPKTMILLKDSMLFDQFLVDMPKLFKPKEWGYIRGKEVNWGDITVVMAQTLINHVGRFRTILEGLDIVLVDECDLANNKTFKEIIKYTYNASVRVGLSGTLFIRKLAKDKPRNEFLISFFGDELSKIKNMELMDRGVSSPVVVKISKGNAKEPRNNDFDEVYKAGIVRNFDRNMTWVNRVKFYLNRGCFPIIIACKLHEHVELLYDLIQKHCGLKHTIKFIHGDVKDRKEILQDFKDGKIEVLVTSLLIKRGQNMPLIKVVMNAAGTDEPSICLQLLGRGTRTSETKTKFYYEDMLDMGQYLSSHSKHRLSYYKLEGFDIIYL